MHATDLAAACCAPTKPSQALSAEGEAMATTAAALVTSMAAESRLDTGLVSYVFSRFTWKPLKCRSACRHDRELDK